MRKKNILIFEVRSLPALSLNFRMEITAERQNDHHQAHDETKNEIIVCCCCRSAGRCFHHLFPSMLFAAVHRQKLNDNIERLPQWSRSSFFRSTNKNTMAIGFQTICKVLSTWSWLWFSPAVITAGNTSLSIVMCILQNIIFEVEDLMYGYF